MWLRAAAQGGESLVDNNAMQPGSRRRLTPETIADLVRGDVRLLGDLRGERRIAQDAQRSAIRTVVGPLVESAEVRDLEAECHRFAPPAAEVKASGHTLQMRRRLKSLHRAMSDVAAASRSPSWRTGHAATEHRPT